MSTSLITIKRSMIFMVIGLVVFALYLYYFVGISQILDVIKNLNSTQYAFYYSLAILAVLGSVFCWSAAWNSILRTLSVHISYRKSYLYYWVGNFADLILPCAAVCGELTRFYLVKKETSESYGAIASSAVTNRLIAYAIVTTGLYIGAAYVLFRPNVPPLITNIFILLIAGDTAYMVVLLLLAFSKGSSDKLAAVYFKIIKRIRPSKATPDNLMKTKQTLASFYNGFQIFRDKPRYLIRPFIFHTLAYVLGLLVFVFIFYALGIPAASPGFYIAVYFIATSFQDASASLSVGSLDILLSTIFILYGISTGNSGVAAVILRSALFWFPLLVGFICVQFVGAKVLVNGKPKKGNEIMDGIIDKNPSSLSEQEP
jgi:glycosyltransferase 2 family protein